MRDFIDVVATSSYHHDVRAVGLKVLKNRLAEYVRLAAAGETILVTDRDRVVAELVPPQANRSLSISDAILADAVRKGWITPPTICSGCPPRGLPVLSLKTILDELAEQREDR